MLVPALLVLGAPITLLRRVLRSGDQINDGFNGPHDCLMATLEWRPTKILFGPFAAWIVFIVSFYVVYFTPIFGYLMRYHWGHQWMLLHFLVAGFMLFEYVIGLDDLPVSLPHIGRLGFVITAMPFHSFFAVITMNAHQIIGKDFYEALSIPWVPNLHDDQNVGGQITWATGEIPMALVLIALCVQWFISDRRDQRRVDASEDADLDESLAAYNDMLARMAGQEIKPHDPGTKS
jgi:cytochrome c oxidase assembly factor CtaG